MSQENGLGDDIVFSASHLIREATQKSLLDDQTELILNVTSSGATIQTCHYYFVNHVDRSSPLLAYRCESRETVSKNV